MKLSPQERAARREAFRRMDGRQKADYIFAYYKVPILLGLVILFITASVARRQLTKKEPVLYLALVNISVGDALENALSVGFVEWDGENPKKKEVYLYRDLYLSDDASVVNHEYAYASRLKLLGAINTKHLDLLLMNRESYDIFSRSGYLLELSGWASVETEPYLTENAVILSDNAIEYNLNEAPEYEEITEMVCNAVDVSALPLFRDAGLSSSVYLGIVANSQRSDAVFRYLSYLFKR